MFNRQTHPACPIFLVKDILEEAETNSTERHLMMKKGNINID